MLINSVKARFNRLSVLSNVVRDVGRVATDPARHMRRIAAARSFGLPRVEIDPQTGFALCDASKIDGLATVIPKLRAFSLRQADELASAQASVDKPFYFNILGREDLQSMPELVKFSVSRGPLNTLVPYFGLVPNLSHIGIFLSAPASGKRRGTQKAHWDNHDRRHVKLFCYLTDVGSDDGPLTFLPADKSWWFRKKTGRILGTFPVRDDSEFRRYFTERDLVEVTGPAGTVAFLDTTRCMHFGSRCRPGGRRLALVIHYTKFAEYSSTRTGHFQDLNMATSPELRPDDLDPLASLVYQLVPAAYGEAK
jgi:hypothetical protein